MAHNRQLGGVDHLIGVQAERSSIAFVCIDSSMTTGHRVRHRVQWVGMQDLIAGILIWSDCRASALRTGFFS